MSSASSKLTRAGAAVLALVLILLAACAQIPRSGPVGKSTDESAWQPQRPCFPGRPA